MELMHSLLKRQIKRYLGYKESIPHEWDAFMNAVNDAYRQMDLDRKMLERSLDLSSNELFEANAEMRAIFQAIPDLLFRIDGSGTILDCKAGAEMDFILDRKKMVGKQIQNLPAKPIGDLFLNAIARVQAEKSMVSIEYSLIMQGQEQFYEARLSPFLDDQVIVMIRNITERVQAEGERKRLVTAIEQSAEGIYLAGTDWIIQYVNPAFERMTGYDKEDIVGRHTRLLKSGQHDRAFYRNIRETLARGDVWSGRAVDSRKDGSLFDVEVTVSPVRNQSGTVINYVAIHRDISHLVKLEKQLSQAQKLEAVGTLAGGIAHDFNNLLMGILGYTSLLTLDTHESHPHYEKLRAIEKQVQSGADLTRQLLGVARAGRYEVKPTDLNELIHKTAALFGRTKKEIRIYEQYESSPWSVDCDRGQIEQILLNLFVNAWQAMPGGGDIYLETRNVNLDESYTKPFSVVPGRYFKLCVTDTGTGMDEKTRERIFDPFFTTKEMGRGTGLGLASTYGIIKGHAGLINVYSEKGHGTTFSIYLPVSDKEVIAEPGPSMKIISGHETVLFVDDEPFITEVAREMLEGLGYRVLAAASGHEALEIYQARHREIDLVILDMIMPVMGGGETYAAMKSINPGIRAILSSGYSINGEAKAIMERGVNTFLQKPFNMKDLSRKIRDVLDS